MFGWLAAHATLCRRAPRSAVSRRARRITPPVLIEMLPGLGSVLYLHASSGMAMPDDLPQGVVVQRAFMPLLSAHWLVAVSAVTDDGPRECCECVDACGRTRARWYLLPDTDYLAWDAVVASCAADVFPPSNKQRFRPDCSSVLNFQLREFAGLSLLEQPISTALSPLGDRVAACIARDECATRRLG